MLKIQARNKSKLKKHIKAFKNIYKHKITREKKKKEEVKSQS